MLFCRVAVNFKTAALQHRNTATQRVTPNPLRLTTYGNEMIGGYVITILITLVIYAILAHSLNIITGRAGQISLGHAAFFGIGAYTAAMLYTKAGFPFWLDVLLAALVAGIVGAILGIPCLRVRDDFLAITTMGINFVVEAIFLYAPFFGGAMGIGGINLPNWFGREMTKPEYFVLILAVLVLLLLLDRKLGRSWIGLAWASIRDDEQAAATMGVDIVRFKVLAFILGSAIAGLAGGFYAHFLTFIMPQNFGFGQSIVILCMVVFGGIGTRWGPILGAIILGVLPEISRPIMEYRTLVYGVLLLAMMRFQPGGLLGSESILPKFFNERLMARRARSDS
jgi:branched-chain amino acid transport system permease protein